MAGRIPHGFIDDLLARADIVDVIDRRVPLKKAGTEYKACCPFHGEKTPSFTVSPAKQFYHCFGCGAHGTAIGFLMEYESLSFPEAVEELASAVGVEVPREEGERGDDLSHLYRLLTDTEAFFRAQLRGPGGKAAVDYLRGRGLSGDIAARFSLGYAPAGFDNLKRHFRGKASEADLLAAGLVSSKEDNGHVYDKFRDRVMFPIRDRRGRVVGFGGRVMAADGGPKYLNSPETPVFHKGNELYGLYEALKDGARPDFLIVVEGYMDVVALAQFGIHNAVASLGTAATSQQVRRLFKTVPRVVFCFDGDRAGRQAAWRALENALPVLGPGHEARFAFLPEGEDPDSLVREEGDEAFLERLDQARPMLEYLFDTLEDGLDLGTVEGKAALTERVRPLLEKVSDGVLRDLLDERVAKRVELDPKRLAQRLPPAPKPIRPVQGSGGSVDPSRSPVRQAIALVLEQPGLSRRVAPPDHLGEVPRRGMDMLVEILEMCEREPHLNTAALLERYRGHPAHDALCKLAAVTLPGDAEGRESEYRELMERFSGELVHVRWDALIARDRSSLSDDEREELRNLAARLAGVGRSPG